MIREVIKYIEDEDLKNCVLATVGFNAKFDLQYISNEHPELKNDVDHFKIESRPVRDDIGASVINARHVLSGDAELVNKIDDAVREAFLYVYDKLSELEKTETHFKDMLWILMCEYVEEWQISGVETQLIDLYRKGTLDDQNMIIRQALYHSARNTGKGDIGFLKEVIESGKTFYPYLSMLHIDEEASREYFPAHVENLMKEVYTGSFIIHLLDDGALKVYRETHPEMYEEMYTQAAKIIEEKGRDEIKEAFQYVEPTI